MPKSVPIAFLIIAILLIVVALKFSPFPIPFLGVNSNQTTSSENFNYSAATPYPTYYSGSMPETVIVNGPQNWEEVTNTPVVVFQYIAIWDGDLSNVVFETKVDEVDNDWQVSSSNSRTIQLLPGRHTYHFSVRAKVNDQIKDYSPAMRSFVGDVSKQLGKVKINSVFPKTKPQKLVLYSYDNSVNLSNWTIESSFGTTTINEGVKIFRSDSRSLYQNIILNKGDYLYLIGMPSPLSFNFYLNRCFGYLTYAYDFDSLFKKDCPRPSNTEIAYFSDSCRQFINNLKTCQIPSVSEVDQFVNDPACRQFLNDYYSYNSCVNRYQSAADFFTHEWFVFNSQDQFINSSHDRIVLRDSDGLLVDAYQY